MDLLSFSILECTKRLNLSFIMRNSLNLLTFSLQDLLLQLQEAIKYLCGIWGLEKNCFRLEIIKRLFQGLRLSIRVQDSWLDLMITISKCIKLILLNLLIWRRWLLQFSALMSVKTICTSWWDFKEVFWTINRAVQRCQDSKWNRSRKTKLKTNCLCGWRGTKNRNLLITINIFIEASMKKLKVLMLNSEITKTKK